MPTKETLLQKITRTPSPTNFTVRELDVLMKKCGCEKFQGGRGSGIGYFHPATKRILQFDGPHPGKELYRYQIKKVLQFLKEIGAMLRRDGYVGIQGISRESLI